MKLKQSIYILSIPITPSRSFIYCSHLPPINTSLKHKLESKLMALSVKAWTSISTSKKSWNVKIVHYTNKLLSTIPYEEACLKSFPPKDQMVREINEELGVGSEELGVGSEELGVGSEELGEALGSEKLGQEKSIGGGVGGYESAGGSSGIDNSSGSGAGVGSSADVSAKTANSGVSPSDNSSSSDSASSSNSSNGSATFSENNPNSVDIKNNSGGKNIKTISPNEIKDHIQLKPIPLYHATFQDPKSILTQLTAFSSNAASKHYKYAWYCGIGIPLTLPMALIPLLPNVPGFYLAYRLYCHIKALQGVNNLNYLLERDENALKGETINKKSNSEVNTVSNKFNPNEAGKKAANEFSKKVKSDDAITDLGANSESHKDNDSNLVSHNHDFDKTENVKTHKTAANDSVSTSISDASNELYEATKNNISKPESKELNHTISISKPNASFDEVSEAASDIHEKTENSNISSDSISEAANDIHERTNKSNDIHERTNKSNDIDERTNKSNDIHERAKSNDNTESRINDKSSETNVIKPATKTSPEIDTSHLSFKDLSIIDELYGGIKPSDEETVLINEEIIDKLTKSLHLEHIKLDLIKAMTQERNLLKKKKEKRDEK